MPVQRARIEDRRAALAEDFGREILVKKFGEQGTQIILETFGLLKSGKNKGKPRGFIHWRKCTVGGWAYLDGGLGRVVRPGSFDFAVGLSFERVKTCQSRDGMPSSLTDAGYLEMLMRGLGVITDNWNRDKDEPISGFPRFSEVRAIVNTERASSIEDMRREMGLST